MKRAAIVLVLVVGCIWLALRRNHSENVPESAESDSTSESAGGEVIVTDTAEPASVPERAPVALLGERILADYANTNLPPENDLTLMSHLMINYLVLVKSAADRPLSANEDWADAFRGMNPAHERYLPDEHVVLNARGQLVDRWHTPLFFHALGDHRFAIRSAGPDKTMWTADDIHRNADGSFRRGENLNPSSLFGAGAEKIGP